MTRQPRNARRHSFKVKRRYLPGTPVDADPGAYLEVAVLATFAREIFAVDLASGAFVRVEVVSADAESEDSNDWLGFVEPSPGEVLGVEVFEDEPVDPGRPETVWTKGLPPTTGKLRRGQLRRLLRAVAAPENHGSLVLGTRVPSVAYTDLDPTKPSMMLIELRARRCRLSTAEEAEAVLGFSWGGLRQSLEIADPGAIGIERRLSQPLRGDALNRFLGFKVRYALVVNLRVEGGYVRKKVLGLFAD